MILARIVVCIFLIFSVNAQIPSFGRCPEYDAKPDFDKEKFLGTWFEVERYFTVTEIVSKCIKVIYERRPEMSKFISIIFLTFCSNNVETIISGKFSLIGKGGDGRFNVRYESFPLNYNASLVVLDTDYKNYAVVWSCSNITPFGHTESAWLLTRSITPSGNVLQAAYGVLDKYKINRSFFVKTDQSNCVVLPPPQEAVDTTTAAPIAKNEIAPEMIDNVTKVVVVDNTPIEEIKNETK
ncbi:hypothetical protein PVAND_004829 [Polypedilum vanderplanki]|uniref:Lipocalin/cytosolic fatty-acid binding domain-containing protein n=1 Tax=Polypedilum vanderplanki TaxID=319348 RepID=A0A9J6BYC6_POLVA|nr:hypothetical protein PVAND_004829 [Polypedilum vanderplanki]